MKNISVMFHAMKIKPPIMFVGIVAVASLLSSNAARAANYNWDGQAGDGLWSSANNWSSNVTVTAADGAQFNNAYGSGGQTISLGGANQTLSQLLIANTTTAGLVTLNNGRLVIDVSGASGFSPSAAVNWSGTANSAFTIDANVELKSSGGTATYFYARPGAAASTPTLSLGGNIQITSNTTASQYLFRFGANPASVIQKSGSVISDDGTTESTLIISFAGSNQTATLNGANTFTLAGGTSVRLTGTGGTLNLSNNAALGATTNNVNSGDTAVTNSSDLRSILITGNQTIQNTFNIQTYSGINTIGGSNTAGNATYAGTIALNRHASAANNVTYLTAAAGGTVLFTGNLTAGTGNGTSRIEKIGGGTTVLNGVNTYAGGTTVTSGTLLINNATGSGLGTGNVTVSGGTLGGTGNFTGSVTINSGGTLAPGASIQSLASGAVSFATGSTFAYELDSGVATNVGADLQRVSGNLSLTGTVTLTLANLSVGTFAENTKFTLFNYNGSWNNGLFTFNSTLLADDSTFSFNGQTWQIDYNASAGGSNFSTEFLSSSSYVNLTAVPEPATWGLLAASLTALMVFRRRKFSSPQE